MGLPTFLEAHGTEMPAVEGAVSPMRLLSLFLRPLKWLSTSRGRWGGGEMPRA